MSGSSIAIVAIGPMPGSTPISVPTSAPAKAKQQVRRRQRDGEAEGEVSQTAPSTTPARPGSVSPSPQMKMPQDSAIRTSAGDEGLDGAQVARWRARRRRSAAGSRRRGRAARASRRTATRLPATNTSGRQPRLATGPARRGAVAQSLHQHAWRRARAAPSRAAAAHSRCPCAARCRSDSRARPTGRAIAIAMNSSAGEHVLARQKLPAAAACRGCPRAHRGALDAAGSPAAADRIAASPPA